MNEKPERVDVNPFCYTMVELTKCGICEKTFSQEELQKMYKEEQGNGNPVELKSLCGPSREHPFPILFYCKGCESDAFKILDHWYPSEHNDKKVMIPRSDGTISPGYVKFCCRENNGDILAWCGMTDKLDDNGKPLWWKFISVSRLEFT